MKRIILLLTACLAALPATVRGAKPQTDYLAEARRMAGAEETARRAIAPLPDAPTATWGEACLALYEATGDSLYLRRAHALADALVDEQGRIPAYDKELYDLADLRFGAFLYRLYQAGGGDGRYLNALEIIRSQLYTQPRRADRLFLPLASEADTVRIEPLYHALPFYCMYAAMFDQSRVFDDIVLQCEVIDECTLDPHSGLNLPAHPAPAHVLLARPSALAMAGLADVLDFMPWDHSFRRRAAGMWQRMAAGLSQCLPRKQAAWGVMPDRPAGTDNPLSLTGTSAAVYAVAKGVRLGYLGKKEGKMAVQAFAALTQQWEEGRKEADSAAWYVLAAVELHRMQQEE